MSDKISTAFLTSQNLMILVDFNENVCIAKGIPRKTDGCLKDGYLKESAPAVKIDRRQKCPQDGPMRSQESPMRVLRSTKMAPRWPHEGSTRAKTKDRRHEAVAV